ncbi:MAG: Txe/YoeB family addiction module toxin [Gammaproteobacteria bacterium]|nr:Txe/YoeB family addiction module toxin [Gammaproteobacteria bacterium]
MSNQTSWHVDTWEDYLYWQKNDKKVLQKINELIKTIVREPFSGIGKPEPLKYALDGYWSRRITQEHRLIYQVTNNGVHIVQCRYHY